MDGWNEIYRSKKHRIFLELGALIDRHNQTDTSFEKCPGCAICDKIAEVRHQLDQLQNQKIWQILQKGENMTKEELRYLLSKDVDRKVIARSLNISTQTLQKYLKRWQLSKRQMG